MGMTGIVLMRFCLKPDRAEAHHQSKTLTVCLQQDYCLYLITDTMVPTLLKQIRIEKIV
jgi:hypothetical protein